MQVQEEMVRQANFRSGAKGKSECIAVSMRYPALSTVQSMVICTVGFNGTIEENILQSGGVAPVCSMVRKPAMHRLSKSRSCRRRYYNTGNQSNPGRKAQYTGDFAGECRKGYPAGGRIFDRGNRDKVGEMQRELLKRANSKEDYKSIADEIYRLRKLKQNALVESAEREGLKK